jgi:hypothetical protein
MSEQQTRREMVAVCHRMLQGKGHLFEGVRQLSDLCRCLSSKEGLEKAIRTLQGIDSELDGLPLGNARAGWAADALEEQDRKRDDYLVRARTKIEDACQAILERWPDG